MTDRLIQLVLEGTESCVLVSSPEFPLLHLQLDNWENQEIEKRVLPVLKEMIEAQNSRYTVELRIITPWEVSDDTSAPTPHTHIPRPHIIATLAA